MKNWNVKSLITGCIVVLLMLFVYGCKTNKDLEDAKFSTFTPQAKTAKDYVDSNEFIDISLKQLKESPNTRSPNSTVNEAQWKAALYRFYSHVKVKDGKLECDLTNGKDINLSEELFSFLKVGIEKTNEDIEKYKKEGRNYILPPVDDNYLNSLLK